jgi:hypothetical protein
MKRIIFYCSFLYCSSVLAQERPVASGGEASGTGGTVSYTIGLPDYLTYSANNGTLSQGLQQAYELLSLNVAEWNKDFKVAIYPNPVIDYLVIEIPETDPELSYHIISSEGKVVKNGRLSDIKTTVDLNAFVSEGYFIEIRKNNLPVRQYQFIKVN